MRVKMILNIVSIYGFITVICLGSFRVNCLASNGKEEFLPVDFNRAPEVLNIISSKIMNNYGLIKTWRGKSEGIMTYGRYRTVEFALDVEKDLLYVDDSPAELIEDATAEGGKRIKTTDMLRTQISIVSPDFYIHSQPELGPGNKVLRRNAFKELRKKNCSTCQSSLPFVFDPRNYLQQSILIIERTFPKITKRISNPDKSQPDNFIPKVEESRNGDSIEYRITNPGKITEDINHGFLIVCSIFSNKKGFNLTSQETVFHSQSENKIIQKRTWDYNLIDGIYILSKTMTQSYSPDTGKSTFYEEIAFKDIIINQPIQNELFSHNNLGLKNGDRFVDKIAGKEYKYQDTNLVFVADIPAPASGKKDTTIPEPNSPPK